MEAIEGEGCIAFTINMVNKQLIITDSGSGIPDAITDQLFSPFSVLKKMARALASP